MAPCESTVHLHHGRSFGHGRIQPAGLGGPATLFFINLKGYL